MKGLIEIEVKDLSPGGHSSTFSINFEIKVHDENELVEENTADSEQVSESFDFLLFKMKQDKLELKQKYKSIEFEEPKPKIKEFT